MELGENAEQFVQNMLKELEGADARAWFLFWLSQPLGELKLKCPREMLADEQGRKTIYTLFAGHAGLQPGRAPWAREEPVKLADGTWTRRKLVRTYDAGDGYAWVAA